MQIRCFDYDNTDAWDLVSTADKLLYQTNTVLSIRQLIGPRSSILHRDVHFFWGGNARTLVSLHLCHSDTQANLGQHKYLVPVGHCLHNASLDSPQVVCIKTSWFYVLHFHVHITSQRRHEWETRWWGMVFIVCDLASSFYLRLWADQSRKNVQAGRTIFRE